MVAIVGQRNSIEHTVQWITPPPIWGGSSLPGSSQPGSSPRQPALLRFATDTFMDDFIALLQNEPSRLPELQAQPETWRAPAGLPQPARVDPLRNLVAGRMSRPTGIKGVVAAFRQTARGSTSSALLSSQALQVVDLQALQAASQLPLKLYQPAHQRFYLVAACLVCGVLGLPDRVINAGAQERVSFVVRRLLPPDSASSTTFDPATWEEYAMVGAGRTPAWQKVGAAAGVVDGEEKLPLFPLTYQESDGRKRRLFAGLVPVGKREAYMGAVKAVQGGSGPAQAGPDPRAILFWSQVREPWQRLAETAAAAKALQAGPPIFPSPPPSQDQPLTGAALKSAVKASREVIQTGSWYALLDFASFLQQYLPDVWQQISGGTPSAPLSAAENALVAALGSVTLSNVLTNDLLADLSDPTIRVAGSLQDALLSVADAGVSAGLEAARVSYRRDVSDPNWPPFLFPLADPVFTGPDLPPTPDEWIAVDDLGVQQARINAFSTLVEQALPAQSLQSVPVPPLASQAPADNNAVGWFVLRFIFERPNCGPLLPAVVSDASQPFQLASFFDPDAPARPVRIALPVDTSPAGLRKFDKNTAFVISDMLCGQINRAKGMGLGDLVRSVLPWPLHKDLSLPDGGPCTDDSGVTIGMICSLSIPIITICALILLMIIVNLLDIIFRWIPFFILCFPLPGLRAKEGS